MLRNQPPERLRQLARGIVTKDYLVADTSRDWLHSLMLLAGELGKHQNLGSILVPVAPHLTGYWINGSVPAVCLSAIPLNKGDTKRLAAIVERMDEALL